MLESRVDSLSSQLQSQLKTNSLLLRKLAKLRGSVKKEVDVRVVLDLLDNPDLDVADVLEKEKNLLDNIKVPKPVEKHLEKLKEIPLNSDKDKYSYKLIEPSEETKQESETEEQENEAAGEEEIKVDEQDLTGGQEKAVIPLLLFSCNRVSVNRCQIEELKMIEEWKGSLSFPMMSQLLISPRALDLLITYRPSKEQFPIIVTQVRGCFLFFL